MMQMLGYQVLNLNNSFLLHNLYFLFQTLWLKFKVFNWF